MTVIKISSDNDFLGLVKKETDIIPFLIKTKNLNDNFVLSKFNSYTSTWEELTLVECFGKNWQKILTKKPMTELAEIFEELFYFDVETVYSYEEASI